MATFTEADFISEPQTATSFSEADFTSDALPSYSNGLSPETPINTSPISIEDRAKLSVGNEAGKFKFLKEKFQDVKKAKNGDFLVKDSGFWHRVDAEGLGSGDAWEQTKELVKDVADIGPLITKTAAQVGAGLGLAALTGGTSLAAQAGVSGTVGAALAAGETSLGRLAGTYESTPEEQLKDIAIESILNIGGTYVAAGAKPAFHFIAKGLGKGAQTIANAPESTKKILKSFLATSSGVGEKNINRLIDNPVGVEQAMKIASIGASSSDDVVKRLVLQNIDDVGEISNQARPALTHLYEVGDKEVIENVDDFFKPNIKGVIDSALKKAEEMGLGKIKEGKFNVFSESELQTAAQELGEVNPLLTDKQSRSLLGEAVEALQNYQGIKERTGKAGASQLMKVRKILFDVTYRLQETADEAALAPAQRILSAMKEAADSAVQRNFDLKAPVKSILTGQESSNLFITLNQHYSEIMREMNPILRAVGQSRKQGSDVPFQTLYQQLQAVSGANQIQKTAFDKVIDVLESQGGEAGKLIANTKKGIEDRVAAIAFTPTIKKSFLSQGALAGAVGSALTGNIVTAVSLAGAAAATSPRLNMHAIKSAMAGKAMLSKFTPKMKIQFLSNPAAVEQFARSVLETPAAIEATKQSLISGVTGGR